MLIYMPLSVVTRYLWQGEQSEMNIVSKPRFLLIKGLFQIFLIDIAVYFKEDEESLHGFLFLFVMALYVVYVCF